MRILLSVVTLLAGLLFAGSISYSLAPKSEMQSDPQLIKEPETLGITSQISTPSATPRPVRRFVPPTPTPSPTPIPTPTPVHIQTIITVVVTPTPIPTAQPSPTSTPTPTLTPSPTPTPTPVLSLVNVEIKEPNQAFTFSLNIIDGLDACQMLQQAKDEGRINSLTLDDRYLTSFNTLLVKEINGFQDNWVFTVNGTSPMGCSLINLHGQDRIVWEYLTY